MRKMHEMEQTWYIFNFGSNLGIDDDFKKEKRERERERESEMYKKRKSF